jgi:lysozyme
LEAYKDQRGIPTIGYGHTGGVLMGDRCTQERAEAWLAEDVGTAERAISRLVTAGLLQNQFDALVSLVYNIGEGNFAESTVLRKLNILDYRAAAEAILMWNKTGGQVNAGLQRRREAERALFLTPPGGMVSDGV